MTAPVAPAGRTAAASEAHPAAPPGVDVVALLPERLMQTLRVVVAGRHRLTTVSSVDELEAALRSGVAECVVIDPQGPGRPGAARLAPVFARHSGLHVIIYTTLTAESMHDVAALGVRDVLLFGCDDRPAYVREVLATAPAAALVECLLTRLEGPLSRMPPELRRAIGELFRAPETVRNVDALRRMAGMSRMTLSRALTRSGLISPWMIVRAARVLRVYHHLRRGGVRLKSIAPRLGYSSPRKLADEVKALTGVTPTRLARTMEPAGLVAHIAGRLDRRS